LERLADEMKIDAEAGEYEAEIYRISAQLDEPVRRVRSRLEKRSQMDVLRNQIVERKVIKLILDEAEIHDQPMVPVQEDTTPVDHAIAGLNAISAPIPDAKYGEQPADQTVGGRP
jgi:FKBP-type peptidyl-prolyl cis-trans isomerase (trigger factor)